MTRRLLAALGVLVLFTSSAHAINHTTDYKTNMDNYRVCADTPLDTCEYEDIVSPSKFFLPHGTTTTLVHRDDGTVQLRIDAAGIVTDTNVTYTCSAEPFPCVGNRCVGGRNSGALCSPTICIGGSNHGSSCSGSSACPSGTCTGGDTCSTNLCHGGLQDGGFCGSPGDLSCESVANSSGWSVVFRGNVPSVTFETAPTYHYRLIGDGSAGCLKVCTFTLGSTGAINSSGLSCSTTGTCGTVDSFHHVELRDPDDEVVAVPAIGAAETPWHLWAVEGDPAMKGDCSRPANAGFCP